MHSPNDNNPPEQDTPESLLDEKTDAAFVILKGLNQLQEKAEQLEFDFLTYLL